MIVLVPPSVSKLYLLNPVLPCLARLIADRNRSARAAERFRLRVAVHAGEVHHDATGSAGTDINLACWLVDDQAVRGLLRDDPAVDMALVVSDAIHGGGRTQRSRRAGCDGDPPLEGVSAGRRQSSTLTP